MVGPRMYDLQALGGTGPSAFQFFGESTRTNKSSDKPTAGRERSGEQPTTGTPAPASDVTKKTATRKAATQKTETR
jgi:hypothetical protein